MEIPSDGQEPEEHDGAPENAAYRRLSSLRDDLQESTGDLKGNDIPSFNRELSFLQVRSLVECAPEKGFFHFLTTFGTAST